MNHAIPPTPSVSAPAVKSNRRRGNRHRLSIPAKLIAADKSVVDVTVVELSVGGVGIQSKSAVTVETVYHLNSFDTLIPPGMKVRIVSQRKAGDTRFDIGAEAV